MKPHKITVTAVPNTDEDLPDDQYIDEVQYTVECPEDGTCALWWECTKCQDEGFKPTEDQEDDGEYTRHGVFHQDLEGMWCTEGKQCAAIHDDNCRDSVYEAAECAGIGTHDVSVDYHGDGEWCVQIIHPPEVRAAILERAKAMLSKTRPTEWDRAPLSLREYYSARAWDEIRKERT
ncbi:hypothetical protein SAMN04487917_101361 [Arthrobacter sp. yr096]|uniref:hypothetical protein n=1 Tax=Arthrobacter sp. yr096 TaxID=1761750 RepID=UPI0008BB5434|nr:hypothetical protein [Arthrobacter sp. yr096]SEI45096.1 hypothetical protein SAMN04487917_101361 [Arthrobacter sp. yr096]